ncbi:MAG: DUF362 domain-containing protein, partial [Deltaproteobacteria bacterium]|nr:DUF362 domain-containing protein [Deltaproteobacteria bacterium]
MAVGSSGIGGRRVSRRRFLLDLSVLASGGMLAACSSGAGPGDASADLTGDGPLDLPADTVPEAAGTDACRRQPCPASGEVVLGLVAPGAAGSVQEGVTELLSTLDWSWLTPGDRVFVKLSCNSGNLHPAVTSPVAVRAVCQELLSRGAGEVLAGDQAGIASVRLDMNGKLTGSTRGLMEKNGLLAAIEESGATPWCFEEHGHQQGFFAAGMAGVPGSHWSDGPWVASVLEEVDHVVTLPRLSSHLIGGC